MRPKPADDNQPAKSPKTPDQQTVKKTAEEPAVERGDRLEAGKEIARAGKESGKVPGAEPSK